ncbi:BapA/Bap/LapF family large adhesin, partial [Tritonibacter mobilis]|uniref:BapA/Bap/LapF family large adhesin n=1 Tax=Tritonibacter mobilis TaxID=379347 RepID=UPI000E0D9E3E
TEIGSAEVDADGNWEITPSTPLDDGEHSLTVTATDPAGNESASSEAFVVEVDATAPDAPDASEITVTDDVDPITGTLEDGDDTNDTLPTFAGAAGSATAGDTVTVYANGESIGTAEVAADGSWSLDPTNDLDDGEYSFTVTYTDEAGNESAPTEILSATVDTGVPTIDTATIDSAYDDVGGTTGDLSSGDTTDDTKPEFTGSVSVTGETLTGLIVTLYADDGNNGPVAVGSVVLSDETGDWTITPDEPLDNDDYTFSITVSDAAGNESTPAGSFALIINGTVPDAPTIDTLSDNVGTVTGDIAPNGVTDDTQPTISGSGAAEGDTVSIFVDGVEVGSTTADVDGNWSLELETPLEAGTHTVTATTTTAAGNESPSSNAVTFTIATEAPAAADNTETIALDVTPSATEVAQADLPSETGFFVANVGLGAVLDLGLIDIEDQIQIDVAEGTVQQLTLTSNAGGVSILTDFDLYIYKYNEDLEQWDLYQSEASWLEVYLLGGVSDELTVTLPEGQYAFILSGDSGVSLLTGYTLNVENQVIFDYNDPQVVQGTVSGNVITDVEEEASAGRDEVPTGTVVTDVDGTAVVDGAPSVIEGSFGTLTIYADGSYTYDVNEDFAGPYGSVDTFTYTVTAPNGTTDSADLSITLELGAADEVVDVDATVVLGFTPTVTTLPEDQLQSSTDVGVLQLATSTGDENAILSATALNEVGGLSVEVAENTVQEITLDANAGGITIYGEYFLAIYKLDEETGNYALYDSDYWFTLYLLGAAADEITVSLPEGSYQLVIASGEAVSLLGGNSIWMTEAVVYDYNDPVEGAGSVIGSVTGDVAEGADTMYRVGEDLFSGDPMVVEGTYGTLEINADGTYTYTVTVSDEAGWTPPFGEIETFTYTTVDSEGNYSVGTLNIEIDMVGANDDTAEVDMDLTNVVTTETVSLYTSTFGGALSTETTDEGSFTVENDADTVTTVDVSFSSEQVGANGTVSWTLYDVNDNVVDSGVFTMTDGTNLSEQLSFDGLTSGIYTFAIDLDESATFGYNEANVEITVTSTELTETELVEVDTVSGNILLNDGATAPSSVVSIEIGGETLAAGSYAGDTSITVAGTHGTLTLGSDGGYTYEPTGDSFGVETFDYTITTAAGTESTAVLTIDVGANITGSAFGDTFASTAGADSFETGAGADTITYDAMNEGGPDVWIDFNQGEGDVLDLSALLSGVTTDNVDNYLEVTNVDGNTVVSVDTAGGAEFTELVVLEGSELSLQDLLENGLAGVSQL